MAVFAALAQTPLEIGSRLELFVSGDGIERLENAELRLNPPVPAEIAVTCDAPWEGPVTGFAVVLKDGEIYRLYYPNDRGEIKEPSAVPMAESRDGIHWTKPRLGLIEFHGSRQNNLVYLGEAGANFAPFVDENPAAPRSQRYKAFGGDHVVWAFVSPDGVRWSKLREQPVITDPPLDSQNIAFWDAGQKQYVAYMRGAVRPDGSAVTSRPWFADSQGGGAGLRAIRRSTSRDFVHWTKPELISFEGGLGNHLYTNAISSYYRAPDFFFGFPMRFVPSRKKVDAHAYEGVSDVMLIASRGGRQWRIYRDALLRPGLDLRNWTDRNLIVARGIVPTGKDEISIYYDENYRHPTNRIRRAALRKDGFVSIHAGSQGGAALTNPLRFSGSELVLNYSTSAAGGVHVELRDEAGKVLPGYSLADCAEIFGDQTEYTVRWRGNANAAGQSGKAVRLFFQLRDADVFSYQFR
jgi:hypothetical protein